MLKNLVLIVVLAYLLPCLGLYFGQRKFLYFPQAAVNLSNLINSEAVEFQTDGVEINGWLLNPGKQKALLYYGGNAEQVEYNAEFFQSVLPDYSVYLMPYRGYGNSSGSPSEKALYRDAEYIYDQIKSKYNSIVVMGRSLGSGVATHMAVNRPVDKVVLVTPYDSIENVAKELYWMFPVSVLLKDKYPSWQRAKNIDVPTLILIAENDRVVLPHRSEALAEHFDSSMLTVVRIAGADHGSISLEDAYQQSIVSFLN